MNTIAGDNCHSVAIGMIYVILVCNAVFAILTQLCFSKNKHISLQAVRDMFYYFSQIMCSLSSTPRDGRKCCRFI